MKIIVLLPGIMGSRLALSSTNEEIWPPTISELTFGYHRLAKLMDPAVKATDVVREVTNCYSVYGSLIGQLKTWGFEERALGGPVGILICWAYDWRIDNRTNAALLSKMLMGLIQAHGNDTELVLLPHSMGGLISRYALEVRDQALGPVTWRDHVSLLVTMGTPHRGAPLALVRALGIEGTLGISASDVKQLAADYRYPAAYQLLPPANAFSFWARFNTGTTLSAIDVLDPAIASTLSLNADNVKAAADFHAALATGARPANCRYFTFIGRRVETVIRGDFTGPTGLAPSKVQDGGDGTVPIWSGTLPDTQFQLDGDEHARTFKDPELLKTLGALLGVSPATLSVPQGSPIRVLLSKQVFSPGDVTRIGLQVTGPPISGLTLEIYPLSEDGAVGPPVSNYPVTPSDASTTAAVVEAILPTSPGLFGARVYSENHAVASAQEAFVVQVNHS